MAIGMGMRQRALRDQIWALVGVFFSFMPIGLIFMTVPEKPGGWLAIWIIAIYTGLNSVAWASTFMFRKLWFLFIIIPSHYLIPRYVMPWIGKTGTFEASTGLTPVATRSVLVLCATVSLVAGFIILMKLVRKFERDGGKAKAELAVASMIHKTLVPDVDISSSGVRVLGSSRASNTMGGDLIDAVIGKDGVDVLLADVSGHGVGAGIVMGMVKASARTLLAGGPTLDRYLTELNRVLCELTSPEMFATAACVRVVKERGEWQASYALAGHHPILLRRAGGEIVELPNDALPLGIDAGERVQAGEVDLAAGDTIMMLTDGLIEVQDTSGRELGFGLLRDVFADRGGGDLAGARDAILGEAARHGPAIDDQSIILIRIG